MAFSTTTDVYTASNDAIARMRGYTSQAFDDFGISDCVLPGDALCETWSGYSRRFDPPEPKTADEFNLMCYDEELHN